MNYQELKAKQSKELNDFPLIFAFTNEQLEKGLEKLGCTDRDIVSLGGGGFMRKSDQQSYLDMFGRFDAELEAAMGDDQFMVDAIEYELANHEYCITYNPHEALGVLGLSLKDDRVKANFKAAEQAYLAGVEWYP